MMSTLKAKIKSHILVPHPTATTVVVGVGLSVIGATMVAGLLDAFGIISVSEEALAWGTRRR